MTIFLFHDNNFLFQIYALCNGHVVTAGDGFIQFWGIIYITARISSLYILTLISIERMMAVCAPLFYRKIKNPHAILGVSICWLLSILVAITPYFFGGKYMFYRGAGFAGPELKVASNKYFMILTEFLATYAPSFMITLSVLVIGYKVRKLKSQTGIRKVTMTLFFVLTTYVTLFLLYFIFVILHMSGVIQKFQPRTQIYIQNFAFLILAIHHAANPIIYSFRATQFKTELRNVNTILESKVNKYVAPLTSQGNMFSVSKCNSIDETQENSKNIGDRDTRNRIFNTDFNYLNTNNHSNGTGKSFRLS